MTNLKSFNINTLVVAAMIGAAVFFAIYTPGTTGSSSSLHNWQWGFQTPASPIMEGIVGFHDDLMMFLVAIVFFVLFFLAMILMQYAQYEHPMSQEGQTGSVSPVYTNHTNPDGETQMAAGAFYQKPVQRLVHAPTLEIVWTIIPALILLVIAVPSFSLLYSVDEILEPVLTVKVIGHQWYWSYELLDLAAVAAARSLVGNLVVPAENHAFDSYMVAEDDLLNNGSDYLSNRRLLTVDNHLFIPTSAHTRLMITSADVLHSWAVPALGVKVDACPGRLNQASVFIKRAGLYYGQCSEICGVNHGFMPIGIVSSELFLGEETAGVDVESLLASLQSIAQG